MIRKQRNELCTTVRERGCTHVALYPTACTLQMTRQQLVISIRIQQLKPQNTAHPTGQGALALGCSSSALAVPVVVVVVGPWEVLAGSGGLKISAHTMFWM